ncbi:TPA: hypothetical protein HA251_02640 [Candidatus Woesearchaeota archaeon]|nr:hypothetical protein [Candidatus Woesearchaeota archaeon]
MNIMPAAEISHIEFWVANLRKSLEFYDAFFSILGWSRLSENSFSNGTTKIYFCQMDIASKDTLGPRHICFRVLSSEVVDDVGAFLRKTNTRVIRGPLAMNEYSKDYYTVDFCDPDNYILEVAYSPHSKR